MIAFSLSFVLKRSKQIITWFSILSVISFVISAYLIYNSPDDYLQREYAKIMFIHVPAAWFSLGLYSLVGLASIGYLAFRNPHMDIFALSCARIGIVYTLITLVTGAIWGKPTWGAWWVWDARLTSMLILFFIYFGYLALRNAYEDEGKSATSGSIFAIIGLINIPIIKFSVYLWNTLHQGSSFFSSKGITIHPDFLWPLISAALFFLFYTCILLTLTIIVLAYNRKYNRYTI